MATTWKAPTWRMPNEKNQNKFESYSLYFSGNNNYITIDSSTELDNIPLNPYSFSFWFKQPSHTGSKVLSEKRATNTFVNAQYTIHSENGSIAWYGGAGLSAAPRTSSAISFNEWHHIVCVAESTTISKIYVDGQLDATSSTNRISSSAVAGTFRIGSNYVGSYRFIGQISQFSIFDYALSSSQASSLYNTGSPINPMILKPAPVAYYPLGGNASTGGTNTLSVPNIAVPDASVFDFDPSLNQWINLNATLTKLSVTDTFSFSTWVKTDSLTAWAHVVGGTSSGSWSDGFGLFMKSSNGFKWSFWVNQWNGNFVNSADNIVVDQWYHIVCTYSDSNGGKMYINNGTPATFGATTLDGKDTDIDIGTIGNGNGYDWPGEITNTQ